MGGWTTIDDIAQLRQDKLELSLSLAILSEVTSVALDFCFFLNQLFALLNVSDRTSHLQLVLVPELIAKPRFSSASIQMNLVGYIITFKE